MFWVATFFDIAELLNISDAQKLDVLRTTKRLKIQELEKGCDIFLHGRKTSPNVNIKAQWFVQVLVPPDMIHNLVIVFKY